MRGERKQSDSPIVVMKRANKEGELSAESVERRGGTKGNSAHQSTDRTQSRATVTQAGVGYGGRRDLPSLPEVGAVCLNGHARICAGGAGQPASLPRLLAADWIGSSAGDCAPAPSHTTGRTVFSIRRLESPEALSSLVQGLSFRFPPPLRLDLRPSGLPGSTRGPSMPGPRGLPTARFRR